MPRSQLRSSARPRSSKGKMSARVMGVSESLAAPSMSPSNQRASSVAAVGPRSSSAETRCAAPTMPPDAPVMRRTWRKKPGMRASRAPSTLRVQIAGAQRAPARGDDHERRFGLPETGLPALEGGHVVDERSRERARLRKRHVREARHGDVARRAERARREDDDDGPEDAVVLEPEAQQAPDAREDGERERHGERRRHVTLERPRREVGDDEQRHERRLNGVRAGIGRRARGIGREPRVRALARRASRAGGSARARGA